MMCIYKERDSTTQLLRCPWRFTSERHVANMQHIGSCSMFPRTPGLSGGRSGFSGFQANDKTLKAALKVFVSSADKDTEKIFDKCQLNAYDLDRKNLRE